MGWLKVPPWSTPEERLRAGCPEEVSGDDCWPWTRSKNRASYGIVSLPGPETWLAHRLAYTVWVGPIPEGHVVRHKCDNPPCINPDHLETGTHADNVKDKIERDRIPRGARHWKAKLSDCDVTTIRSRVASGETQSAVARDYQIDSSYVSQLMSGKYRSQNQEV